MTQRAIGAYCGGISSEAVCMARRKIRDHADAAKIIQRLQKRLATRRPVVKLNIESLTPMSTMSKGDKSGIGLIPRLPLLPCFLSMVQLRESTAMAKSTVPQKNPKDSIVGTEYQLAIDGYEYRDQLIPQEFASMLQGFVVFSALLAGFQTLSPDIPC